MMSPDPLAYPPRHPLGLLGPFRAAPPLSGMACAVCGRPFVDGDQVLLSRCKPPDFVEREVLAPGVSHSPAHPVHQRCARDRELLD